MPSSEAGWGCEPTRAQTALSEKRVAGRTKRDTAPLISTYETSYYSPSEILQRVLISTSTNSFRAGSNGKLLIILQSE